MNAPPARTRVAGEAAFSRRLGAAVLATMLAVLGGGVALSLAVDREATEHQVLHATGVLAETIAAQAGALVGGLDQALLGINHLAGSGASATMLAATMTTRENALPDGIVLAVVDDQANPVLATAAGHRRLAGLQPGMLAHGLGGLGPTPVGQLNFLPPMRSVAGPVLPLVERLEDGRTAVALLPLRLMEGFYARLGLGSGAVVLLLDESGRLLSRMPPAPAERVGQPVSRAALITALLARGEGWTGLHVSQIDGISRYAAVRPVPGQPLAVAVAVRDSEALAQWRRRAWLAGSLTTLAILTAGAGLLLVEREARRRLDAQAAASARLELLARGSAGIAAMAELPALLGHVGRMARETLAVPYACIALHEAPGDGGQHAVSLAPAGGWFRPFAPWQHGPAGPQMPSQSRRQPPAGQGGAEPPPALLAALEHWATNPSLAASGPGPRLFPAEPLAGLPARAAIALRDEQGRPLGALTVARADDTGFSTDDAAMLSQLGRMAGIAIRNRLLLAGMQRAAEEASSARERIERLLESVSDGFIALDAGWQITYANAAALRLLRRRLSRVVGHSLWELYPVLTELEAFEQLHAVASLGQPREFEQHFAEAGRWFQAYAFTAADGVAVFFRDITETRQTQELMRASQRMEVVGQLTGSVAHDFNNLLAVIMGNAEMLEDTLDPADEENRHAAWLIRDAGDRGAALVRRLLAFASHQPQAVQPVVPEALLEGLLPLLRRSVGDKVQLVLNQQEALPRLLLDLGQAENALLNLVINARDAMPEGGTLTIALAPAELDEAALDGFPVARPGRFLRLAVTDTGSGMTPEVLARAAEPFFSTKTDGRGSGLGLASVYSFVRQSGGVLRLESQPGEGTCVTMFLPADPATAVVAPAHADLPSVPTPQHGGTEHVLLVEDEVSLRHNLTQQLSRLGYHVTALACGPSTVAALQDGLRPDLMLLDVILPGGISGPRLAALARQHIPGLPVLLMSGYALAAGEEQERALPLLVKPCPQPVLARRVRHMLDAGDQS
jgi:signal transduction histidine kinase